MHVTSGSDSGRSGDVSGSVSRHVEVRRGVYYDSVTLLGVSRDVERVDGVEQALVAMATPLNLELLHDLGFAVDEVRLQPTGTTDRLQIRVVVADRRFHAAELAARAAKAIKALVADDPAMWRMLRAQGVFVGQGAPGKVAFLYPGQGSQYVNMLRDMRGREPIVAATFAEADRVQDQTTRVLVTALLLVSATAITGGGVLAPTILGRAGPLSATVDRVLRAAPPRARRRPRAESHTPQPPPPARPRGARRPGSAPPAPRTPPRPRPAGWPWALGAGVAGGCPPPQTPLRRWRLPSSPRAAGPRRGGSSARTAASTWPRWTGPSRPSPSSGQRATSTG